MLEQVNVLNEDDYETGITREVAASIVCGCLACLTAVFLALMLHPDTTAFAFRVCRGILRLNAIFGGLT